MHNLFKTILTFSFEATGFVNVLDVPSKPRLLKPDEVFVIICMLRNDKMKRCEPSMSNCRGIPQRMMEAPPSSAICSGASSILYHPPRSSIPVQDDGPRLQRVDHCLRGDRTHLRSHRQELEARPPLQVRNKIIHVLIRKCKTVLLQLFFCRFEVYAINKEGESPPVQVKK